MFAVIDIEGCAGYIDVPDINKYSEVCLIKAESTQTETLPLDIDENELPDVDETNNVTGPTYVFGDFVSRSLINDSWVGLVGLAIADEHCYIGLDARRTTLGLRLADHELKPISAEQTKIVLHFRK